MMRRSLKFIWNVWNTEQRRRSLWFATGALLLTLAPVAQLVHFQAKEDQLARREHSLKQTYDDIQNVVHTTEQVARQIETDLREQQRMMVLMEVKLRQKNDQASAAQTAIELPLERAPVP